MIPPYGRRLTFGLLGRTTLTVIALAVAATFILALPSMAYAKNVYVSAFGSDDAGDGSSPVTAFATVQHAIAVATSGDIIQVGAGTFAGDITTKDGVSLQGAGPSVTTLAGSSTGITARSLGTSISGFTITGNGNGIYCDQWSSPSISNNTITGNGNGIYCDQWSSPSITNNTITGNTGVGIYCDYYFYKFVSSVNITNNTITGNTGDGIYCTDASSPNITNNTIRGNGNGIHCYDSSSPNITKNTITGNTGDGVYCDHASSPSIANNTIAGNDCGIYSDHWSSPNVTNNTITGNTGVGIYCDDYSYPSSSASITNCILWGNSDDLSHCFATYSDIEHMAEAVGMGNITKSPSFVSAAPGDYHLNVGSPCIDKGTSLAAPRTDKDGAPRPCGGGYDMGAYEFHAASYQLHYQIADANGSTVGSATQLVDFDRDGSSITAVPTVGYHFVSWSDGVTTPYRTDTNVTADATYTASFAVSNPHQLHYVGGANGTLSGQMSQTVDYDGSGTSVTASPGTGYRFAGWSDGKTNSPRTDTNVTADATYTANFAADPVTTCALHYVAGVGGTLFGATAQVVDFRGGGSAVTASPTVGYHFVNWSDGTTSNPRTDTNVTASATYTANFGLIDIAPPITTCDAVAYYASSATIHLAATDSAGGSGVAHTYYTLNSGARVESSTVRVRSAGSYTLAFWSVDTSSNVETAHTVRLTVITPPSSKGTPSTPASIATLGHGRSFTVYGYVIRHASGTHPVGLRFYRYKSGHWVYYKTTSAKASTVLTFSKYSDSTSVKYSGTWRVRARHWVGSHYHYSSYRYFTAG